MPTTFAHYTFGNKVYQNLPEDLKTIVTKYRALYDTGVHGPDLLFYYKALVKNPVTAFGSELHTHTGKSFFESCRLPYVGNDEKEPMLAYLLGFLSHYVLDSYCHGYIEAKKEASGISHNKIEAEYDRHLLEIAGKNPRRERRTKTLKCHEKEAAIIARFFPYDVKTISRSVNDQRFMLNLLHTPFDLKFQFICKAVDLLKVNPEFKDLMISPQPEPLCRDSNLRLDKLMAKAVSHYPELMENLLAFLEKGEALPDYFQADFGTGPDYQSIPVLSLEEEIHYLV